MEENTKPVTNQEPAKEVKSVSAGVPLKTIILIVVLAIVAVSLVYVAFFTDNSPLKQIIEKSQEVKNPAETILAIDENAKDEETGEYYSIVTVDTGTNNINGVQLELYFDPALLTNVTVTPLDFFPQSVELLKKVDQQSGRISYALTVSPGESAVNGKGNLVKISYTPIGNAQISSVINFLPKTEASGEGTAASLLKETHDGSINIEERVAVPLSPASATVSPTP
ncbi:MAG: hypothetical protein HY344_00900 [Candidatus Levybacteria bacterium]|nr:hypothetical protein [Candidatus Levybacteria bacterium]